MRISTTLCALLLAMTGAHAQKIPGFEVLGIEDVNQPQGTQLPTVVMPHVPIYRTDAMGLPVVSWAGYLQLRHEGAGFVYASMLPTVPGTRNFALKKKHAKQGKTDTNNWGDVDCFRLAAWTIRRWLAFRPDGPPLVIGDISAENGGYGDYNDNGLADHRTHQLGMNFNFHLPGTGAQVRAFHIGRYSDDYLDVNGTRKLITLLAQGGARMLTTNINVKLSDVNVGSDPIVLGKPTRDDHRSVTYRYLGCSLNLLRSVGSHGEHINAGFYPR